MFSSQYNLYGESSEVWFGWLGITTCLMSRWKHILLLMAIWGFCMMGESGDIKMSWWHSRLSAKATGIQVVNAVAGYFYT